MNDCPFCLLPNQHPEEILTSNEQCYLLATPPGHLKGFMVIPFQHIETPFDLSAGQWAALQPLVHAARELLAIDHPDGFNLGWNVGEVGGQEVPHVHLHVFARFADEPFAGFGIRKWLKSDENRRRSSS